MPILTLTTDWGLRDHYLASFKGEIFSQIPSLTVIDITHEVEKFNMMQAAYIVQNSFRKFPRGSIHYIGIAGNENCQSPNPYLIVKADGHFLLGEDNGIFTLILGKTENEIIRLPLESEIGRKGISDSLLKAIRQITEGTDFLTLGTRENVITESYFAQPAVDMNTIRGTIIFIDSFGNAVINITRDIFDEACKGRKFIIYLRKSSYDVTEISSNYEDVEVGDMLALFNQDGYLEIALNKESAGKLLGLKLMDTIRIEFG